MMSLTFGLFTQVSGLGPLGPLVFFFLHQSCGSGVMPLFRLCMKNLVNRISEEPLKLES